MSTKKAIYIRVTPEQRKLIQAAAASVGVSVSKLGAALLLSFSHGKPVEAHSSKVLLTSTVRR